jgi:hypothetical protein
MIQQGITVTLDLDDATREALDAVLKSFGGTLTDYLTLLIHEDLETGQHPLRPNLG